MASTAPAGTIGFMAELRPRRKKAVAVLAVAAGVFLLFFEARNFLGAGGVVSWFWLAVGGLAVVLGVIELTSTGSAAGR